MADIASSQPQQPPPGTPRAPQRVDSVSTIAETAGVKTNMGSTDAGDDAGWRGGGLVVAANGRPNTRSRPSTPLYRSNIPMPRAGFSPTRPAPSSAGKKAGWLSTLMGRRKGEGHNGEGVHGGLSARGTAMAPASRPGGLASVAEYDGEPGRNDVFGRGGGSGRIEGPRVPERATGKRMQDINAIPRSVVENRRQSMFARCAVNYGIPPTQCETKERVSLNRSGSITSTGMTKTRPTTPARVVSMFVERQMGPTPPIPVVAEPPVSNFYNNEGSKKKRPLLRFKKDKVKKPIGPKDIESLDVSGETNSSPARIIENSTPRVDRTSKNGPTIPTNRPKKPLLDQRSDATLVSSRSNNTIVVPKVPPTHPPLPPKGPLKACSAPSTVSSPIPPSKPTAKEDEPNQRHSELVALMSGMRKLSPRFASRYRIGDLLGDGAFGFVLTATRIVDEVE
ncbi:hypothetical protein HK104_004455, partial [Borealophlyctis nickersoniae]